jgi:deazaflavin-dependent oxidoreductase (nitroreductase family)
VVFRTDNLGLTPVAATYKLTPLRRLGNFLIGLLVRLGLTGERTHLLTVPGRKSGRRYTTPVELVIDGDKRWLVAPYGERGWVKNGRAAGSVELRRGRRTTGYSIEEVDADEAAPVLREYLRTTPIVRPYFDADENAPLEAFAAEAHRHPVFRLRNPQ